MTPSLKKLIQGNRLFKERYFNDQNPLFEQLSTHGQQPRSMIVACSDSRVDPAVVFSSQPGDLFVIRNVANLVPPCEENNGYHGTSAALEFGVCFLHVEHIIIFGHTQCGGIQALVDQGVNCFKRPTNTSIAASSQTTACPHDPRESSFITSWMELAQPAYERVMQEHGDIPCDDRATLCEQYALVNSLHNLATFPWINERVAAGTLELHAWYFDLSTGLINTYDAAHNRWRFL